MTSDCWIRKWTLCSTLTNNNNYRRWLACLGNVDELSRLVARLGLKTNRLSPQLLIEASSFFFINYWPRQSSGKSIEQAMKIISKVGNWWHIHQVLVVMFTSFTRNCHQFWLINNLFDCLLSVSKKIVNHLIDARKYLQMFISKFGLRRRRKIKFAGDHQKKVGTTPSSLFIILARQVFVCSAILLTDNLIICNWYEFTVRTVSVRDLFPAIFKSRLDFLHHHYHRQSRGLCGH